MDASRTPSPRSDAPPAEPGEIDRLRAELAAARARIADLEAAAAATARELDVARTIVANSPLAVSITDAELRYRYVSPMHLEASGRTAEELIGRTIAECYPLSWAALGPIVETAIAEGRPYRSNGVMIPILRDGAPVETYWDVHYIPLRDDAGRHRGMLGLSLPVTERVAAEQAVIEQLRLLERANLHKEQFLGILSHELRTPINAIMGFSSVLDDGVAGPLNEQQARYVERILTSSDRMLALVDDLLDMSRIQAGKVALAPRPLDLAAAARGVLTEHAAAAEARGQTLRLELPTDLPPCLADPHRLAQILGNLVANAVRYAPAGGTIAVRAHATGEDGARRLRVAVHDAGEALAPEAHDRLFEPFMQMDMTATRAHGGLGLGLSIVKALVGAHGGDVGVDSAPGAGTAFWFELPAAA